MQINYIVLAHKNPAQVKRLVQRLSTEATTFYIHVDQNVALDSFMQQLATIKNCSFVATREKGTWGDLGIVKATVHALRQVVADRRSGYCVLVSGQDYPIKSNQQIAHYLHRHHGTSFIEACALPNPTWDGGGLNRVEHYKFNLSEMRQDYITVPPLLSKQFAADWIHQAYNLKKLLWRRTIPWVLLRKRRFPPYLQPCGGSQWWAIPVETAKKVLAFLDRHPTYLPYHRHTLLPDEIALQSVVRHVLQAEANGAIQPPVTYVNWERPGVELPVTFTHHDLPELLNQPEGKLFARKFDAETDATVLDLLDHQLQE